MEHKCANSAQLMLFKESSRKEEMARQRWHFNYGHAFCPKLKEIKDMRKRVLHKYVEGTRPYFTYYSDDCIEDPETLQDATMEAMMENRQFECPMKNILNPQVWTTVADQRTRVLCGSNFQCSKKDLRFVGSAPETSDSYCAWRFSNGVNVRGQRSIGLDSWKKHTDFFW